MIGKIFGQLTVVAIVGRDARRNLLLRCECTCGATVARVRADNLTSGNTQSCRCLGNKRRGESSTRRAVERAKGKWKGSGGLPPLGETELHAHIKALGSKKALGGK